MDKYVYWRANLHAWQVYYAVVIGDTEYYYAELLSGRHDSLPSEDTLVRCDTAARASFCLVRDRIAAGDTIPPDHAA